MNAYRLGYLVVIREAGVSRNMLVFRAEKIVCLHQYQLFHKTSAVVFKYTYNYFQKLHNLFYFTLEQLSGVIRVEFLSASSGPASWVYALQGKILHPLREFRKRTGEITGKDRQLQERN